MYPVDNLCPTKRLLNTFREICNGQEGSKFVAQDRTDRPKQKLDLNKSNIFSAARKELEMKKKRKCAVMIQRWWRKVRQDNQQSVIDQDESQTERKVTVIEEIDCKTPRAVCVASPFEVPLKAGRNSPKSPFSICPTEMVEYLPQRINFKLEEDNLVIPAYQLPQIDVSPVENEAVFSNSYPVSFHP